MIFMVLTSGHRSYEGVLLLFLFPLSLSHSACFSVSIYLPCGSIWRRVRHGERVGGRVSRGGGLLGFPEQRDTVRNLLAVIGKVAECSERAFRMAHHRQPGTRSTCQIHGTSGAAADPTRRIIGRLGPLPTSPRRLQPASGVGKRAPGAGGKISPSRLALRKKTCGASRRSGS